MKERTLKAQLFSEVKDPRLLHRITYPLDSILFISLCTVICGGEDYQDMERFGKLQGEWLSGYIDISMGTPSHDTFKRIYELIDIECFMGVLENHTAGILSEIKEGYSISIDGKKLRGESPKSKGNKGLYLMNAYINTYRLVIGQSRVEDKSNEITALPQLIKSLEIEGHMVIVDAMGCQTEIAETIREKQGDYLLQVKGNQEELLEEIKDNFDTYTPEHHDNELDYGHGRIEHRSCSLLSADQVLGPKQKERWRDIKSIIKIESKREMKDTTSTESRYYISSKSGTAEYFNREIRGHWRIENSLHWVLDVVFGEDKSRIRTENGPENFSLTRKLALQIIRKVKDKNSIGKRRFSAALSTDYLDKILKSNF